MLLLRLENNLRITLNTLIKLVICHRGIVERDCIRDHKARLRSSGNNHVTQVAIIALDIALSSSQAQALLEELSKRDQQTTFFRMWVYAAWIGRHIKSRNSQNACWIDDLD